MRTYNNLKNAKPPKEITDLRHLLASSAECFGEKPLYIYKENGETVEYTKQQHYDNVLRFGTALAVKGLMGKRIAVVGTMHPKWLCTFFSTIIGGGAIVPLDPELKIEEMLKFIDHAECSAIVYSDKFNNVFTAHRAELPLVEHFIPMFEGENDTDGVIPFDELLAMGTEELDGGNRTFADCEIDLDKMAAILFTSGTTGTSKGVMLSHRNFVVATNSACKSMSYDDKATFVSVLPIYHTYELTCLHLGGLNIGATIFINDSLRHAVKNIGAFKPNTMVFVPLFLETIHKKIWEEIRRKGMEKKVRAAMKVAAASLKVGVDIRAKLFGQILSVLGGNLTSVVAGGAPLSPELVRDFYYFGITILQGYGITECSPLVAVNRAGNVKFDAVGQPVENCEVKIDFPDENGEGEILVRGGNVMMGYYKNPEATAEAFTEDGWFRTGDIGRIDEEQFITITGRKKNLIIASNGKNVYPEEIEEYLATLEYLSECVVLAREGVNGEAVITAIVVPNTEVLGEMSDDVLMEKLKADVNEINRKLPSYKAVRNVEIRHEEFEKTSAKKIKRYLIK